MADEMFLTAAEVGELTGIKKGKRIGGRLVPREVLQAQQLRSVGVPFYPNARGRPIVARAVIEGRNVPAPAPEKHRGWQPRVMSN